MTPTGRDLSSLLGTIAICLFACGGLFVLAAVPFPTPYDELQHLSLIRALREMPAFFPAHGTYRTLSEDGGHWTAVPNYLAHPPLYYLLLAPLADHVVLLRTVNLVFATAGFALCARAGLSLLATAGQRLGFLALLLMFSKPALVAGMINNDNLVFLETGLIVFLLAKTSQASPARGSIHRAAWVPYMLALFLAASGWTKFNAFVGLSLWVGLVHIADIARGRRTPFGRTSFVLLAGVVVGALPALHNLMTIGAAAYVPRDLLFVLPADRPGWNFATFAAAFFDKIGRKISYSDDLLDLTPVLIGLAVLGCAASAARDVAGRARDLAVCGSLATLSFATLHVLYGWHSFQTLGTLSDAQSRYYVMLWPGFALAAVVGASALAERLAGRWARRLNQSNRARADATRSPPPDQACPAALRPSAACAAASRAIGTR